MYYPLHLFPHGNMTPAILKKQVGNPINMLSEGRKIFYGSFLIDLFKNIFANYKHAHIMILFIGFLKYVTSAQIGKLEHLIDVIDFLHCLLDKLFQWLLIIWNGEERWSHQSVSRIDRIPIHVGIWKWLAFLVTNLPKATVSVYGTYIQTSWNNARVGGNQRSVKRARQV